MEMQKMIFKFVRQYLKLQNTSSKCCLWSVLFLTSTFVLLGLFINAQVSVLPNNHFIQQCQESINFEIQQDSIGIIYNNLFSLQSLTEQMKKNEKLSSRLKAKLVNQSDKCIVYKNSYVTINSHKLQFSYMSELLYFDQQKRQILNIDNYTYILKSVPSSYLLLYDMHLFRMNQLLKLSQTNNKPIFITTPYFNYSQKNPQKQLTVFEGIKIVLSTILFYGISSFLLQLFIKQLLNVWVLLFVAVHHLCQPRQQAIGLAKRLIPWIGVHLAMKQSSSHQQVKKNWCSFYSAFLLIFLLYYLLFQVVYWSTCNYLLLPTEQNLLFWVFIDLYMVQFCALIYLRSRVSMKYFPKLHTLIIVFVLIYAQLGQIGCKMMVMLTGIAFDLFMLTWFVRFVQIPAITNERIVGYRPTEDQPRAGMLPIFNLNWVSLEQDVWTFLIPAVGKEKGPNITEQNIREIMQEDD